jgi:hypothetical protein
LHYFYKHLRKSHMKFMIKVNILDAIVEEYRLQYSYNGVTYTATASNISNKVST